MTLAAPGIPLPLSIRPLTVDHLPRLSKHWKKHWGDEFVAPLESLRDEIELEMKL